MSDIFISYASEDRERIRPLAHALEARGWSVFWDPNIPTGKSWREVLDDALTGARCVVVAWSDHSIVSRWVHEEAEEARERSILIPVFIEKVRPPLGFRGVQAADLSEWDDTKHSDVFEKLVADIDAHLGLFPGETSKADQASRVAVEDGGAKEADPADTDRPAEPLALPDKPSIAVLPFDNMSADPEQEFFADGITEDLLTKLTSILGLFVIARYSSFHYKGKTVDVRQVSKELGVRYVLEGSVQKAGNRVRVTVQLIEAATGSQLWAEHYDRDLTDVFAVQDDITANVVQALQVTLLEGEQARVWHRSTKNLEAWSCLTRAKTHFEDHLTMEESRIGIELLERAVDLDPDYASAWAWLGWLLSHEVRFLWTDDPDAVLARAAQCGNKALALDDGLAEAHMLLAFVHVLSRDFDKAIAQAERGVALGPSNADVVAVLALNLIWAGQPEEALTAIEKAMRLSPMYSPWFTVVRAHALRLLGQFEEAMKTYKGAIADAPGYIPPYIGLTLCYAEMGREHDAQEQGRKLLKLNPRFSTARYLSTPGYKDDSLTERSARALRQAGLPD